MGLIVSFRKILFCPFCGRENPHRAGDPYVKSHGYLECECGKVFKVCVPGERKAVRK